MTYQTPLFHCFGMLFVALTGCSSSDTSTPTTDSSTDTPSETSDAFTNTCTSAGGTCIALTPTSKCSAGTHASTDASIHCAVGGTCCLPDATDSGNDASDATDASDAADTSSDSGPEAGCTSSGGTVGTSSCCASTGDFPNTCLVGACSCAPSASHDVKTCNCPSGKCFDGKSCVAHP